MANCGCCSNNDKAEDKRHTPFMLAERVQYAPESIVSSQLSESSAGTLTIFSFDTGQSLSTHSAPFEAIIQVVDGEAAITIGDNPYTVKTGEMLIMPANIPHSVEAKQQFKMVLTMFRAK